MAEVEKCNKNFKYIFCPICNSDKTNCFMLFGPKDIVRCNYCGLVYVNPQPLQRKIKVFFEHNYISSEQMLRNELGRRRIKTLKRIADLIKRIKQKGIILDIGCAGGEFLKNFISRDWICYGVEPSTLAIEVAKKYGIYIFAGLLNEVNLPAKYFDVITFLDVLYISSTPKEDLMKAYFSLKDDGILVIEIPGFIYRVFKNVGLISFLIKRKWCNLSSSNNQLFYFSTSSLKKLLKKVGFKIIKIYLEQAPLQDSSILQIINNIHFAFSKFFYILTFGQINLAAKVVYICKKLV